MKVNHHLKGKVVAAVDELLPQLNEIALAIYGHPELAFQEEFASALLTDRLAAAGFVVERGLAGLPTAFRAVMASPRGRDEPVQSHVHHRPVIAFLAEYDALPGLGHACGHNLIAAAAAGAAMAAARILGDVDGVIQVIGTPAEEGGGGKIILARQGVFEGVDAAMMVHPADVNIAYTSSLATQTVEMVFHGKASHAAASPGEGVSALAGVIETFNALNALRLHLRSDVRLHGIITEGGTAVNIIPERAAAKFSVRALDHVYLEQVLGMVRDCADGAARATRTTVDISFGEGYKELRINRTLADVFHHNLLNLGVPIAADEGGLGSTDMGDISQVVPAIHPYVAAAPLGVACHTKEFAALSGGPSGLAAVAVGAKAMAMTATDLLIDGDLLGKVKKEFAAWRR